MFHFKCRLCAISNFVAWIAHLKKPKSLKSHIIHCERISNFVAWIAHLKKPKSLKSHIIHCERISNFVAWIAHLKKPKSLDYHWMELCYHFKYLFIYLRYLLPYYNDCKIMTFSYQKCFCCFFSFIASNFQTPKKIFC